jgi:hypothetical protein
MEPETPLGATQVLHTNANRKVKNLGIGDDRNAHSKKHLFPYDIKHKKARYRTKLGCTQEFS